MIIERYEISSEDDSEFDVTQIFEGVVDISDPRLTLELMEDNPEADAFAPAFLEVNESDRIQLG
jgi:hypothetical protein